MSDDKKRFLLRLSPELWEDLSRWAADELRSVNGQIEYLLRETVRRHRRRDGADAQTRSREETGER